MKKKNLKNLVLQKRRISNLTTIHRTVGGTATTDTETETNTNPGTIACVTENVLCNASQNPDDCATNAGTVKSPPPSEYYTCKCNVPGF